MTMIFVEFALQRLGLSRVSPSLLGIHPHLKILVIKITKDWKTSLFAVGKNTSKCFYSGGNTGKKKKKLSTSYVWQFSAPFPVLLLEILSPL